MAISRATVQGREGVASWLNANATEYFASVTYSSSGYQITAKDSSNNTLFIWDGNGVTVYKSATVYDTRAIDTRYNGYFVCAKCNGGIMIYPDPASSPAHTDKGCIIITKTINNKTAIIVGGGSSTLSTSCTSGIVSAAWGDATDASKTISYSVTAQNQTQFVPFTTYAVADSVSYTPNAFFLPTTQYNTIEYGKITDGYALYITNGFWAIKDVAA
jgi:hypothetical protein